MYKRFGWILWVAFSLGSGADMLEDLDAWGPGCWSSHRLAWDLDKIYFFRYWIERILKTIYLRVKIRNYQYLEKKTGPEPE